MPLKLRAVGKSDRGLVRKGNEDFLYLDDSNHVYVVCDGMGGHQAGEVASMTAADTIQSAFVRHSAEILADNTLKLPRTLPSSCDMLVKAIRLANRAVFTKSRQNVDLTGMGTTVVAMAFEADIVSIAHVGDSRAYRLTDKQLIPLTIDHSWINEVQTTQNMTREEATSFVGKNIITRALGVRPGVDVDCRVMKVHAGDVFILCSDGLCGYADDEEIFSVAGKCRSDISLLVDNLVQMANDRGGSDNVTVVAIQVLEISPSPLPELETVTFEAGVQPVLEAEDGWISRFESEPRVERANHRNAPTDGHPNKFMLLGLFAVFVIVAALIIFYTQHK